MSTSQEAGVVDFEILRRQTLATGRQGMKESQTRTQSSANPLTALADGYRLHRMR